MFFLSKKYDANKVFERLLKEREDDIFRVVNAKSTEKYRREKSERLLRWCLNNAGIDNKTRQLSSEEIASIKDTWSDIWDLGIINTDWHRMYTCKTGTFDPSYIPSDFHFYYVEQEKIDFEYHRAFLDKNYIDIVLPTIKHPPVLIRKIHGFYLDKNFRDIGLDSAVDLIYDNREDGVVVKISIGSFGGSGVSFLDGSSTKDDIREALTKAKDIHVEKVIQQHPEMAKMNPSSVNTVRFITAIIDGQPILLSSCVRIGNAGSKVDNISSGGASCGIKDDGTLKSYGFTHRGDRVEQHPNGFKFSEGRIPNYEHVLEEVKRLHMCVPMFGFINWDICIDPSGEPVLVEYNVGGGNLDFHQYNNGPVYGQYREKIVSDAFKDFTIKNGNLDYNFTTKHNEVTIKDGSYHISNLSIPAELMEKPVKIIGTNAFHGRTKLKTLSIYADLKEIQYCAFYSCSKLSKIVFYGKVNHIGRSAFNNCPKLLTIQLPQGTETIGMRAFSNCKRLKEIFIPESVKDIGEEAFLNCSSKLTIHTIEGSFADQYAKKNGICVKYS